MAEDTDAGAKKPDQARRGLKIGLRSQFILAIAFLVLGVMAASTFIIQRQQGRALDREIRERGLALARSLASSCVESMFGDMAALEINILTQGVIQSSDDPEAYKRLFRADPFPRLVTGFMKDLGRPRAEVPVRNEGVMFAKATDAAGKVIASSDATKPRDNWGEEWEKPYQPPTGTGTVGPADGETVWETDVPYAMYVIGVPIRQEGASGGAGTPGGGAGTPGGGADTPGEGAAPAAEAGAVAPSGPGGATVFAGAAAPQGRFLGVVYLGMSKEIIRRALALAVAKLILVALAMLVVGIGGGVLLAGMMVKPIHALRDGVMAVGRGVFDHRVKVKRRDELGALARSFNEMTQGLGERELIRSAFGAYVSSDVLNDILANPDAMKVGGARRTVTRMFTDVRGFTAMSEKLDPAAVVKIINEYLDVQAKAVGRHKGYLDRFIGDAVSAVFGVPAEAPDDAIRAVKCAWVIKQEVAKMIEERTRQGLLSPKVGIGLDTGPAIAGNLGAQGIKLDYSVIGDPVTGSEAIQDAARDPEAVGAQVLMSENTWQLVKDVAETRELAPLTVKGRSKPIRIFELAGMKGA